MTIHRLGSLIIGALLLLSLGACVVHDHHRGGGHHRDRPPGHWRR